MTPVRTPRGRSCTISVDFSKNGDDRFLAIPNLRTWVQETYRGRARFFQKLIFYIQHEEHGAEDPY